MKTNYDNRGLISLYVNFLNNRTMWSTNFHVKSCRWGKRKKSHILKKHSKQSVLILGAGCLDIVFRLS